MSKGKGVIEFKLGDVLDFHFDPLDLILPDAKKLARSRGITLEQAKMIVRNSKVYSQWCRDNKEIFLQECVLKVIKKHKRITEGNILRGYAPGLINEVRKALKELETKGHVGAIRSRGATRYYFLKDMVVKKPDTSFPSVW